MYSSWKSIDSPGLTLFSYLCDRYPIQIFHFVLSILADLRMVDGFNGFGAPWRANVGDAKAMLRKDDITNRRYGIIVRNRFLNLPIIEERYLLSSFQGANCLG